MCMCTEPERDGQKVTGFTNNSLGLEGRVVVLETAELEQILEQVASSDCGSSGRMTGTRTKPCYPCKEGASAAILGHMNRNIKC